MKFEIDAPVAKKTGEDEEVPEKPFKCKVAINGIGGQTEDNKYDTYRVDFLKKKGDYAAFSRFYKEMMKNKLYMFVEDREDEDE